MKQKIGKKSAVFFVFALNMILFILMTAPFKIWVAASELTQMRPAAALTPVLGMIFGMTAALGCAAGNFICDMAVGCEFSYALLNSLLQIVYAMFAYVVWKNLNRDRNGKEFRLDSVAKILKFCLLLVLNAVLTVILTAVLNHAYNVADIISMDNLFILINSFDSGLLFGTPLLIFGSFLQTRLSNMRKDTSEQKIVRFTMSERMIINTLITGICICLFVGVSVYLADKYGSGDSIGVLGKIYLFETLAMNTYFALSIGFMRFTEKKISRPIEELAEIAGNYNPGEEAESQHRKMADACSVYAKDSTEVGELARSYISMIHDIEHYVSDIRRVMAEKERINAELSLASDIQAHMLPCIFPPFPEHEEFDLYALMNPAKEVGGDFYDFFMIGEDRLAVVVADVSGKGVPAALFMVITKVLIKNHAQMGMEPADVFTTVNRLLCDGNDVGLFVTAWMGVLELSTGKFTYVNAGHNPPLLKSSNGKFEYLRSRSGFVLAGMEDTKYRQNTLTLEPGSRLFLYTDGVTETTDICQQLYGEDRLQNFLNNHSSCATENMLKSLRADLQTFAGEAPQFDDITMLLMDFKGATDTDTCERFFEAKEENIAPMLEFVESTLEANGCNMKTQTAICVAIEEVFVNIVRYAYPSGSGTAKIRIDIDEKTHDATFVVSDSGIEFDPLKKDDPDITLSAEERSIGGLGIFIVKKTMDSVSYLRENGENKLTMTKNLERAAGK